MYVSPYAALDPLILMPDTNGCAELMTVQDLDLEFDRILLANAIDSAVQSSRSVENNVSSQVFYDAFFSKCNSMTKSEKKAVFLAVSSPERRDLLFEQGSLYNKVLACFLIKR